MKISCNVVRDILPLYFDEVCSDESRTLVKEHLEQCPECRAELKKLKYEIECPTIKDNEAKPLEKIANAWEKGKKKSFIKGTIIALVICGVLIGGYAGLTQWKCIPVSMDLMEVSDVVQLEDGRIMYHLQVNDDKTLHFIKFTTNEDGSYYITPMRSVIEKKRVMENGLYNDYFFVDVAENNAWQQNHGDGIEITSVRLGTEKDSILIWEKGMDLPKADKALEKSAEI